MSDGRNIYAIRDDFGNEASVSQEAFDIVGKITRGLASEVVSLRVKCAELEGDKADVEALQARNDWLAAELAKAQEGWSKQSDLNRELARENIDLRSAKANAIPVGYAVVEDDLGRQADVSQSAHVIIQRIVGQKNKVIEELKAKDHVCADSCAAKLGNANAEKAKWKERYEVSIENNAGLSNALQVAKCKIANLEEGLVKEHGRANKLEDKLNECYCCYPANEMEVDVLKAIRKARG